MMNYHFKSTLAGQFPKSGLLFYTLICCGKDGKQISNKLFLLFYFFRIYPLLLLQ